MPKVRQKNDCVQPGQKKSGLTCFARRFADTHPLEMSAMKVLGGVSLAGASLVHLHGLYGLYSAASVTGTVLESAVLFIPGVTILIAGVSSSGRALRRYYELNVNDSLRNSLQEKSEAMKQGRPALAKSDAPARLHVVAGNEFKAIPLGRAKGDGLTFAQALKQTPEKLLEAAENNMDVRRMFSIEDLRSGVDELLHKLSANSPVTKKPQAVRDMTAPSLRLVVNAPEKEGGPEGMDQGKGKTKLRLAPRPGGHRGRR